MNEHSKKVVAVLLPQLALFLVLAVITGTQSELSDGLKLAGIAILSHVLWAPCYYAYLKHRARKEAAAEERRRQEWEADAPSREVRLAIAKAIAAHVDARPQKGQHA